MPKTREEYLKKLILEKFGTVKGFARMIEMPPSTLYSILRNVGGASIEHIFKICRPLNITAEQLAAFDGTEKKQPKYTTYELEKIVSTLSEYDYIPRHVTACKPVQLASIEPVEKIALPNSALGRYAGDNNLLFVHVNGDSMDKVLEDGALIAIERGVSVGSLRDKDIVVIDTDDGYMVKMFFEDFRHNRLLFKPLSNNPSHIPIVFPIGSDVKLVGRVVSFIVTL